jgi:hypothetical protein
MNPANKKSSKAGMALALAMAGLTLYWCFTYSGPYRYLAELQLKWFRVYYPELTAMIIILGMTGVLLAVKFLFRGAERPVLGTPTPTPSANLSAPNVGVQEPWLQYVRYAFLLVPFGLGGWMYYNGTHTGSLQQLNAADFLSGKVQSRILYADVRGHLHGPYLSKDNYRYIPMTSEDRTGPVQLVIGIGENEVRKYMHKEADGTFSVRGVADKGLDGDVKYAFEKNGLTVADSVWVVHAGRDPYKDKNFGLLMIGIGVAMAALIFGMESYRKRKRTAPRPLPAIA